MPTEKRKIETLCAECKSPIQEDALVCSRCGASQRFGLHSLTKEPIALLSFVVAALALWSTWSDSSTSVRWALQDTETAISVAEGAIEGAREYCRLAPIDSCIVAIDEAHDSTGVAIEVRTQHAPMLIDSHSESALFSIRIMELIVQGRELTDVFLIKMLEDESTTEEDLAKIERLMPRLEYSNFRMKNFSQDLEGISSELSGED